MAPHQVLRLGSQGNEVIILQKGAFTQPISQMIRMAIATIYVETGKFAYPTNYRVELTI